MHWTRNSNLVEVVEESLSAVSLPLRNFLLEIFYKLSILYQLLTGTNGPSTGAADTPGVGSFPTQYPAAHTSTPNLTIRPNSSPDLGSYPVAAHHAYPAQIHAHTQAQLAPAQYQQYALPPNPVNPSVAASSVGAGVAAQRNSFPGYAANSTVQAAPAASNNTSADTNSGGVGYARATSGTIPSLPSSFPELETLTTFQLQRLLNDPVALEVGF